MKRLFTGLLCSAVISVSGQAPLKWQGKFEQLDPFFPTPNEYRTGSGAPGPAYWQQRADYTIDVTLNDVDQTLAGVETITYHNNSPDALPFLWLQLDQNNLWKENTLASSQVSQLEDSADAKSYAEALSDYEGGFQIKSVTSADGKALPYTINNTMMRVDLPSSLKMGDKISFNIAWSFNINDRNIFNERGGYEFFPEDGNYLYTMAQFFPRMCVYDDYEGWQNKQFLGQGEFALPFGNYKVKITVPADHIIAATGELNNAKEVLEKNELSRLETARTSFDKPVIIVTEAEAIQREKNKVKNTKTWEFHAENVRDFAFASSRKFIWEAQAVKIGTKTPLAMSFYPKEGNPLWEREATKAVKNCIEVYSKYTIDYPYPVAIAVHAASIAMEYPMICFDRGRPSKDGRISQAVKQGMVGVIIHEVGHNFFPMIINSDERQTTWMDEGLNSFVQLLTEIERYPQSEYNWTRGVPGALVPYMKSDPRIMRPLMTNSEQVIKFGNEQYAKAATALFILRETVMGRELFDKALKEYAERWAFKHPKPSDFFRTMEDASAVDLDWFWRGWFYTTEVCDISIDRVRWFRLDPGANATKTNTFRQSQEAPYQNFNAGPETFTLSATDISSNGEFLNRIDDNKIIQHLQNKNIYEISLSNKGGLIMPVIIEWTFKDGTKQVERIPAEIWRITENKVSKVFVKEKEVASIMLDPLRETTDIDETNNFFPRKPASSKLEEFKKKSN